MEVKSTKQRNGLSEKVGNSPSPDIFKQRINVKNAATVNFPYRWKVGLNVPWGSPPALQETPFL